MQNTTIHDFATLKAELSFGCDSVRYTSVKKVYVFDCNSDVVWCFASCIDFVDVLLYTKSHELQSNTYTFFTEVYLTESQPKDSPASNVAKSWIVVYSRTSTKSMQLAKHQTTSELQSNYICKTPNYICATCKTQMKLVSR